MFFTLVDLEFLTLGGGVLAFAWHQRIGLGAVLHIAFFVLFVPGLQTVWRLGYEGTYDQRVYLAAHVVALLYIVCFTVFMLAGRQRGRREQLFSVAVLGVEDWVWETVLVMWLASQVYLLMKYGTATLYAFRAFYEADISSLEYFDASLNTLFTYAALGGVLVYLAKSVYIPRYWRKLQRLLPISVFLFIFLILGGSVIGVRRTQIFMALYCGALVAHRERGHVRQWLVKRWKTGTVALLLVIVGAIYYQQIRNNAGDPEIADLLLSGSPKEQLQGILRFATPRGNEAVGESAAMLRSGPFNLIYKIAQVREDGGLSTHGDLVWLSLQSVIPRVMSESKSSRVVDEVMTEQLGIVPDGQLLTSDLPTSVVAIFTSDFGLIGIALAAALVAAAFLGLSSGISRMRQHPIVLIAGLGVWFQIACNVEGDLVTILSGIRNVLLLALILIPIGAVVQSKARRNVIVRQ